MRIFVCGVNHRVVETAVNKLCDELSVNGVPSKRFIHKEVKATASEMLRALADAADEQEKPDLSQTRVEIFANASFCVLKSKIYGNPFLAKDLHYHLNELATFLGYTADVALLVSDENDPLERRTALKSALFTFCPSDRVHFTTVEAVVGHDFAKDFIAEKVKGVEPWESLMKTLFCQSVKVKEETPQKTLTTKERPSSKTMMRSKRVTKKVTISPKRKTTTSSTSHSTKTTKTTKTTKRKMTESQLSRRVRTPFDPEV